MTSPEKTNPEAMNLRGSQTTSPSGHRESYGNENSGPRSGCPARLTSERFPNKRLAIFRACDRGAVLRAVADFVHAGMFVRHVSGTYGPLTREALANEAFQCAKYSGAAKEIKAAEVAAIVTRMDDMVRDRYAG